MCFKIMNKRPRIDDPAEFALIKSIYFEKDNFNKEESDPIENLERQESRHRNLQNNSR